MKTDNKKSGGDNLYNLILLSIAPIIICAFYIYIRDRYEKEPIYLLVTGIIFGIIISIPIGFIEKYLERFTPVSDNFLRIFYLSYIVAGFCEEFFKFVILYFLIWREKNFNEPFDGIVYSVIISLGFAMVENILYVINPSIGGVHTAFTRAIFSVPGHGFFGVAMGYYFALAKYNLELKKNYMLRAILLPIFLHGTFNFILLYKIPFAMLIFIMYAIYLWNSGQKKMKLHLECSPFKNKAHKK